MTGQGIHPTKGQSIPPNYGQGFNPAMGQGTHPNNGQGFNPYGGQGNLDGHEYADDGGDMGEMSLTKSSRIGFIRKVYCILSTQLLTTAGFTVAVFESDNFRNYLHENLWILIVSMVLSIVCIYAIGCYRTLARSVPINYILLSIFTLAESILVAAISSQYDASTVMIAAALTAAATVGLTIYAFNTKTDFTVCGGILFVLCLVLLVATILGIFIRNRWLQLVISCCGALLFSVYLVYDTQLLLGKHQNSLGIDEYIWAAMNLYIDIINMFLYILEILGKSR